ncbi:Uncharacterized conserved protein YdiU, UPF0061 family [Marinospirillum celere]|uniref:Protein nucleotidyltransferase YdiU n=1 Tax=Marinospirillum celere TaxID=1122252 RepID=A0A1I1E556_9GAMM|nr:YdiU family protein [Marinospirillum celere]SFB82301.1 Uncharacterized conserved protein YdiU, UPF0061 family [Marinospirillum celere]
MSTLDSLNLDNRYAQLPQRFFQFKAPERLRLPGYLVGLSTDTARLLGLDPCQLNEDQLVRIMTGHASLPGSEPLAMKYAGHQFGYYNPDLGDGRGLLLGEVTTAGQEHWELHLKGAGQTAFSRFGDGRAVLRSSIREFLGSEALHHLGIPTTRALAVVMTGESVRREQLEPGATLLRVTPSHLRFGHFEHFYYRQDHEGQQALLDFALQNYFPELLSTAEPAAELFAEVMQRTARLVAHWQALGFCHGVLNTDNMSLLGETLDYGPFAFLDFYQPGLVANHSDDRGRYAFEHQPDIVQWNLACLAQSLIKLAPVEALKDSLQRFPGLYQKAYRERLSQRLGLDPVADWPLVKDFLSLCEKGRLDWTQLLRLLAEQRLEEAEALMKEPAMAVSREAVDAWLLAWEERTGHYFATKQQRQQLLESRNPWVLPRTHLLQKAIEAAEGGDFSEVERQLAIFKQPFDASQRQPGDWESPPVDKQCLSLSCSS